MDRGYFVTFEGGEGAGKTTQIQLLAEAIRSAGLECIVTREPGGTKTAEAIRSLMFSGEHEFLPVSDLLLMNAARADHVERLIKPALAAGQWVLCDRFTDSTRVYQALDSAVPYDMIEAANHIATLGLMPDLTLLLDIAPEKGLARRQQAGELNRFDEAGLSVHKDIRERFLTLSEDEPLRFAVINADGTVEDVAASVLAEVNIRYDLGKAA